MSTFDVGTGISAAGDLLGGVGSLIAGNKSAKGYQAAADIAGQNANIAASSAAINVMRQERTAYSTMGTLRADAAANGSAVSGSALDIMRMSASNAALDKAIAVNQGEIDVSGWQEKQASYTAQASAAKSSGGGGFLGGLLSAAGTILSIL